MMTPLRSALHKVERGMVWLSRARHCRGFGVQSPWAYRLVCEVINDHTRHAAYGELREQYAADRTARRRLELYYRFGRAMKPREHVDNGADRCAGKPTAVDAYVRRGIEDGMSDVSGLRTAYERLTAMVVASEREGVAQYVQQALDRLPQGALLIIEDIGRRPQMRRLWRHIVHRQPGVVTFDLYYCGLVFFDKKRYKQNYIINF